MGINVIGKANYLHVVGIYVHVTKGVRVRWGGVGGGGYVVRMYTEFLQKKLRPEQSKLFLRKF